MNINIDDFFEPVHFKDTLNELDYNITKPLVDFARSLSQLTYQSVYLIDYYKKGFLFVSDNPIFLCGRTADEVLKNGYQHYLDNVPEEDLLLLKKINDSGFDFLKNLSEEDRMQHSISYDFHLKQPIGKPILINHKLKPLLLDNSSNLWIALCLVSISSHAKAGNIRIKNEFDKSYFEYDLINNIWSEKPAVLLKKREKDILRYSAQGLTMEQIAEMLFVSIDTIKFYKKQIFSKLKVKSITEATAIAIELSLF